MHRITTMVDETTTSDLITLTEQWISSEILRQMHASDLLATAVTKGSGTHLENGQAART